MSYGYTSQPNSERPMVQVGTRLTQAQYWQLLQTRPDQSLSMKVREALEQWLAAHERERT